MNVVVGLKALLNYRKELTKTNLAKEACFTTKPHQMDSNCITCALVAKLDGYRVMDVVKCSFILEGSPRFGLNIKSSLREDRREIHEVYVKNTA